MLSAIKSGMLDSYRSLSNITGSCPTNQCSWKQHTTLAVCSSVEDISSTTVVFNKSVENFSISVQALKDLNRSPPIQPQIDRGVTFWMESLYLPSVTFKYNASSAETKANDKGLPNLAEVYVVYYPSCNGTLRLSGNESDAKSWRALKGTFKLCLQTLESNTTDGKTNTTIVNEWTDIFARVKDVEEDMYCAQIGQEPKSCAGANQWSNYGKQIAEIFNGSASLRQGGDNNIYAESALTLVLDVLGVDPTGCTSFSSTDGLKGFGMRLNNVATSMTNA
jgi:hypothetical protein